MIYLTRKENETTSALVRRFSMRVLQSGVLRAAKTNKFYKKEPSRNLRRNGALAREQKKREYARLKKLGRVK